jgi:hypothetical protein
VSAPGYRARAPRYLTQIVFPSGEHLVSAKWEPSLTGNNFPGRLGPSPWAFDGSSWRTNNTHSQQLFQLRVTPTAQHFIDLRQVHLLTANLGARKLFQRYAPSFGELEQLMVAFDTLALMN